MVRNTPHSLLSMPPQLYDRGDIVLLPPDDRRATVGHCNSGSVVVFDPEAGKDYYVYALTDVRSSGDATEVIDDRDEYALARMLFDYMLSNGTSEDIDDCLNWYRDHIGKTKDPHLAASVRTAIDVLLIYNSDAPADMRATMKDKFIYTITVQEINPWLDGGHYTAPRIVAGALTAKKQCLSEAVEVIDITEGAE